ncbi:hypothetical protein KALB_5224 [Kutzneria albida DSM 43870]|uniref:Restriction endonuclease AspBHI N-terminal domain-containing protein n=1 Tax=Kutzneria albida DSM 43870 TaxID=1449976 RepID=W5WDC6_9PSEU|nr:hypothetical protein KALB_5224 [Kutzneria albida DSM 43870]
MAGSWWQPALRCAGRMITVSAPVPFDQLGTADLCIDQVYQSGRAGNSSDDALHGLLGVGNQGGFRYQGSVRDDAVRVIVLYTTGQDPYWPDRIDLSTGTVTYFGDNKTPGRLLHDTPRQGNEVLRRIFDRAHGSAADRERVPPVLVFAKAGQYRDVVFRGLADRVHRACPLAKTWWRSGGSPTTAAFRTTVPS